MEIDTKRHRAVFLLWGWLFMFPPMVIKNLKQRFLLLLGDEYCEFSIIYGPVYDMWFALGEWE